MFALSVAKVLVTFLAGGFCPNHQMGSHCVKHYRPRFFTVTLHWPQPWDINFFARGKMWMPSCLVGQMAEVNSTCARPFSSNESNLHTTAPVLSFILPYCSEQGSQIQTYSFGSVVSKAQKTVQAKTGLRQPWHCVSTNGWVQCPAPFPSRLSFKKNSSGAPGAPQSFWGVNLFIPCSFY